MQACMIAKCMKRDTEIGGCNRRWFSLRMGRLGCVVRGDIFSMPLIHQWEKWNNVGYLLVLVRRPDKSVTSDALDLCC